VTKGAPDLAVVVVVAVADEDVGVETEMMHVVRRFALRSETPENAIVKIAVTSTPLGKHLTRRRRPMWPWKTANSLFCPAM
jgi:hypothetical protein